LQIKLVPGYLLPLAALVLWLRPPQHKDRVRGVLAALLLFGACMAVSYAAIDFIIERGAYLKHFGQTWSSHFGPPKGAAYGSAQDFPFDWSVLLKNWDTSLPALLGIVFIIYAVVRARAPSLRLSPSSFPDVSVSGPAS